MFYRFIVSIITNLHTAQCLVSQIYQGVGDTIVIFFAINFPTKGQQQHLPC